MTSNSMIKETLMTYHENELILASKLYRTQLMHKVSEESYYKTLERMCKSGELVKIAKGTYHLPKKGKYGIVPPSEKEIISAFTENETGTVIGYSLYNSLGLTTQIAKTVTVMSNSLESFTKTIRNITVHQVDIQYSKEIESIIHCLEVLQNYYTIQDMNYSAFIKYAECFAKTYNEEALKVVLSNMKYKKSTISFLHEILNYYQVNNSLDSYLSSLSEYKHPNMGEIYETARISK